MAQLDPRRGRGAEPPAGAGERVDAGLELTLAASRDSLHVARDLIETFLAAQFGRHGASELLPDMLLALQEAMANVVRHAYAGLPEPGAMQIRLHVSPWLLRCTIVDAGRGFDFDAVPPPDFAHPRDGGYGVHLMRQTMSRVSYRRAPGRNALLLEKALPGSRAERVA